MKNKIIVLLFLSLSYRIQAQGWDWVSLGTNSDSAAYNGSTAISGFCFDNLENIYMTGEYVTPQNTTCVSVFDGSDWPELGTGSLSLKANNSINVVTSDAAGNIYAAGVFKNANGNYYVAKWDGTHWIEIGQGANELNINYQISQLVVDDNGIIYCSGYFTNANDDQYIMKWDGTSWTPIEVDNSASKATITTLALDNHQTLYAGVATFTDNVPDGFYILKRNASQWDVMGTGTNAITGVVLAVVAHGENIYAAGSLNGSANYGYVAQWDGTSWNEIGTGNASLKPSDIITTIAVDDTGYVYAAGYFNNASNKKYVAKWNGTEWSELGSGSQALNSNAKINQIKISPSGRLIACGYFNNAKYPYYIAEWKDLTVTAIQKKTDQDLHIQPNPGSEIIQLTVHEAGIVNLYTATGSLVLTQKVDSGINTLLLKSIPAGIYTLSFTGENHTYSSTKLIKD